MCSGPAVITIVIWGTVNQKYIVHSFGISSSDDVAYNVDIGGSIYPPESVWYNDTCLMVDTEPSTLFTNPQMYIRDVRDVELTDSSVCDMASRLL